MSAAPDLLEREGELAQLGALHSPALRGGEGEHLDVGAAVIGDVFGHRADSQKGRGNEILHGRHHVAQMDGVVSDEAIAPIVQGHPELRRSGGRFGDTASRMKTEIRAAHV